MRSFSASIQRRLSAMSWWRMVWEILRLSLADVRHDWILSSCVVCALAAVFSPLLILYGLKHGYIEVMRNQLLNDPRNLELRALEVPKALKEDWFTHMRTLPDVAFVLPSTLLAYSVNLKNEASGEHGAVVPADVVSSGSGDPLLQLHRLAPPGDEECILTEKAALALNATEGEKVRLTVLRYGNEEGTHAFTVRGVLASRSMAKSAVLVTVSTLNKITFFKYGLGVPEYGWAGGTLEVTPTYSQVLIITPERLPTDIATRLQTKTGFSQRTPLEPADVLSEYAITVKGQPQAFRIESVGHPGGEENIARIKTELNGRAAVVVRTNPPISATLSGATGPAQVELVSISLDGDAKAMVADPLPQWALTAPGENGSGDAWKHTAVSPSVMRQIGPAPWKLKVATPQREVSFPIQVESSPNLPAEMAWIPSRLGGILHAGRTAVGMTFDSRRNTFVIQQDGYRSFRLFAHDLNGVERLSSVLAAQGIKVDSSMEQIGSLRDLDANMTVLVELVGAVTGAGAIGALLTSLLASIERKKREFGVLRLMGTARPHLILIPLAQAELIVGVAFGLAVFVLRIFAFASDRAFYGKLGPGETFCSIQGSQLAVAWVIAASMAALVALAASARLFSIEPADAIRWE
jgi:putative ABC transport system permease protein